MEMMYKAKVIRDASGMSNDISFSDMLLLDVKGTREMWKKEKE